MSCVVLPQQNKIKIKVLIPYLISNFEGRVLHKIYMCNLLLNEGITVLSLHP